MVIRFGFFAVYRKGEKEDLNETEKRTFKVVLENLKALARGNK
jgi:toxin higB-2